MRWNLALGALAVSWGLVAVLAGAISVDPIPLAFYRLAIAAITLVLVALAISNVAGLERDRRIMTGGPWFGPVYAQSELLKASLRGGFPDPRLDREYREFFHYDRGRR